MPNTKKRSNTRIFSILGKISIVLLYIWLSACSILSKDPNNTDLWDAKKFYEEAKDDKDVDYMQNLLSSTWFFNDDGC